MITLVKRVRSILLRVLVCTILCVVLALPIFFSSSSTPKQPGVSGYEILRTPFIVETQKIETRFILFKTHKTGSSTLANIFMRFGAKHGLSFLSNEKDVKPYEKKDQRTRGVSQMSVSHHIIDTSINSTMLINWYRKFLPEGQLVSILRQPLDRYVSAFNFFFQPDNPSFTSFLESGKYRDALARDHGIHTEEQLDHFIKHEMEQFFWFTLDKFDECLILFKNRCFAPSIFLNLLGNLMKLLKSCGSVRSKNILFCISAGLAGAWVTCCTYV